MGAAFSSLRTLILLDRLFCVLLTVINKSYRIHVRSRILEVFRIDEPAWEFSVLTASLWFSGVLPLCCTKNFSLSRLFGTGLLLYSGFALMLHKKLCLGQTNPHGFEDISHNTASDLANI